VATNRSLLHPPFLVALVTLVTLLGSIGLSWNYVMNVNAPVTRPLASDGAVAWESVYSVLTYPRCINCHTTTDFRHRHFPNVVRGPEGRGVVGLNCAGCHQEANADATGVPGAPGWRLAPLSMHWQDTDHRKLSSSEVCRALIDPVKNHGLDGPGLLKHHEKDPLVLWAWNPGRRLDGTARSPPPLTHEQFVDATRRWVAAGTPCP
jgi:hypothetical protein